MANRFVRSIRDVKNVNKQPLHTNEQNDLLSDNQGNVYVRTRNRYVRITGANDVEFKDELDDLQKQINALEPNDTNTYRDIKDLKRKFDKLQEDVGNVQHKNYDKDIEDLQKQIDDSSSNYDSEARELIDGLQSQINEVRTDIDKIKVPNYDDDIKDLKSKIDDIPDYKDDISDIKSDLDDVKEDIKELQDDVDEFKDFITPDVISGVDLEDKDSLEDLPQGRNYIIGGKNKTDKMKTNNGWITIDYTNNVRRITFQPYSSARIFYNYIYKDKLGDWEYNLINTDSDDY